MRLPASSSIANITIEDEAEVTSISNNPLTERWKRVILYTEDVMVLYYWIIVILIAFTYLIRTQLSGTRKLEVSHLLPKSQLRLSERCKLWLHEWLPEHHLFARRESQRLAIEHLIKRSR